MLSRMSLLRRTGSAREEYAAAHARRQEILDKSGLPVCETAEALVNAARGLEGDALLAALKAISAHADQCPVCRARHEYAERHGPPLPPMPLPISMRVIMGLSAFAETLATALGVPPGDAGKGRRMGIGLAVYFTVIAATMVTLGGVSSLLRGNWASFSRGWSPALILLIPLAYFVGFFLAGGVFDLTRGVSKRFIGYLTRGAIGTAALYGAMVPVVMFTDKSSRGVFTWVFPLVLGAVGGLAGSAMWVLDWARGRLD
jgi:hypothetical protein